MYCYLEFKLSYLKNLKLFSIRVKELSEPILLQTCSVGTDHGYGYGYETMGLGMGTGTGTRP